MGLFDFFKNNSRNRDVIHIKNMILVATADSVLEDTELTLITHILSRMNVSEECFQRALSELEKENKIKVVGQRLIHTDNALSYIEAVPVESFDLKLKYLQDYVLVMMSDGSIDEREKKICIAIAEKMRLPASSVDVIINNVAKKTNGYGTTPAPSSENKSGASAQIRHLYDFAKQQAAFISNVFRPLSDKGMAEAKIMCVTLLFKMTGETIDEEGEQDLLFLLASDLLNILPGNSKEEKIDFLNSRIAYYHDELNDVGQPECTGLRIYNPLYVRPFTKEPANLGDIKGEIISSLKFYIVLVEVFKNYDNQFR